MPNYSVDASKTIGFPSKTKLKILNTDMLNARAQASEKQKSARRDNPCADTKADLQLDTIGTRTNPTRPIFELPLSPFLSEDGSIWDDYVGSVSQDPGARYRYLKMQPLLGFADETGADVHYNSKLMRRYYECQLDSHAR
jgi:hypothetical protein